MASNSVTYLTLSGGRECHRATRSVLRNGARFRFPNEVFFFIKVLESIGIELSYSTDEAFEGAQGILKASMGITDYQGGRMGHLWCI